MPPLHPFLRKPVFEPYLSAADETLDCPHPKNYQDINDPLYKRRVESIATQYLAGSRHRVLTTILRGPFDNWKDPWLPGPGNAGSKTLDAYKVSANRTEEFAVASEASRLRRREERTSTKRRAATRPLLPVVQSEKSNGSLSTHGQPPAQVAEDHTHTEPRPRAGREHRLHAAGRYFETGLPDAKLPPRQPASLGAQCPRQNAQRAISKSLHLPNTGRPYEKKTNGCAVEETTPPSSKSRVQPASALPLQSVRGTSKHVGGRPQSSDLGDVKEKAEHLDQCTRNAGAGDVTLDNNSLDSRVLTPSQHNLMSLNQQEFKAGSHRQNSPQCVSLPEGKLIRQPLGNRPNGVHSSPLRLLDRVVETPLRMSIQLRHKDFSVEILDADSDDDDDINAVSLGDQNLKTDNYDQAALEGSVPQEKGLPEEDLIMRENDILSEQQAEAVERAGKEDEILEEDRFVIEKHLLQDVKTVQDCDTTESHHGPADDPILEVRQPENQGKTEQSFEQSEVVENDKVDDKVDETEEQGGPSCPSDHASDYFADWDLVDQSASQTLRLSLLDRLSLVNGPVADTDTTQVRPRAFHDGIQEAVAEPQEHSSSPDMVFDESAILDSPQTEGAPLLRSEDALPLGNVQPTEVVQPQENVELPDIAPDCNPAQIPLEPQLSFEDAVQRLGEDWNAQHARRSQQRSKAAARHARNMRRVFPRGLTELEWILAGEAATIRAAPCEIFGRFYSPAQLESQMRRIAEARAEIFETRLPSTSSRQKSKTSQLKQKTNRSKGKGTQRKAANKDSASQSKPGPKGRAPRSKRKPRRVIDFDSPRETRTERPGTSRPVRRSARAAADAISTQVALFGKMDYFEATVRGEQQSQGDFLTPFSKLHDDGSLPPSPTQGRPVDTQDILAGVPHWQGLTKMAGKENSSSCRAPAQAAETIDVDGLVGGVEGALDVWDLDKELEEGSMDARPLETVSSSHQSEQDNRMLQPAW